MWIGGAVEAGLGALTGVWKKYIWKKREKKTVTIRSRLIVYNWDDATSTWLTNLAADSQQRVQNQYGRNRCRSHHLGVVADNGPEGEDQDWARDQNGNKDQCPTQPLIWNDP